ncbi:hypothetical protein N9C62_09770 [Luminiphilus sp.]|nr:hypothetical protein [Luminiphilus sp.]
MTRGLLATTLAVSVVCFCMALHFRLESLIPEHRPVSPSQPDMVKLTTFSAPHADGRVVGTAPVVNHDGVGRILETIDIKLLPGTWSSDPSGLIEYDEDPPYFGQYTKKRQADVDDPLAEYASIAVDNNPQDLYKRVAYTSYSGVVEDAAHHGYSDLADPGELYPHVIFTSEMSPASLGFSHPYQDDNPPYSEVDYER